MLCGDESQEITSKRVSVGQRYKLSQEEARILKVFSEKKLRLMEFGTYERMN